MTKIDIIDNILHWDGLPVAEFLDKYPSETAKAKAGIMEMQEKIAELEKYICEEQEAHNVADY